MRLHGLCQVHSVHTRKYLGQMLGLFLTKANFGFNQGQFPLSSHVAVNVVLRMVELLDLVCCVMYKYVLDRYVLLLSLLLLLIPCMLISKIHHFLSSMWYGLRKSNFK